MHRMILKTLILAAISMLCADAMAVAPGFYMGLMMGPATNEGSQQPVQVFPLPTATNPVANTVMANPKSSQFGSRLFLGYKFNQYAGFEGGFTYFSGVNYILKNTAFKPTGGTTARVRGIDVVGKIDYSCQNTFGVFAKGGVAALYITTPGGLNVTNYHTVTTLNRAKHTTSTQVFNSGSNSYSSKLTPTFTLGASYDFNQNWVMDASWTTFMVGGVLSKMNLYAIGFSYHFVDMYCGQFLC